MRGYINIPSSIKCNVCKHCGTRPIISLAEKGEYIVKCPISDQHYQTPVGLIDIDDWNRHNSPANEFELEDAAMVACYDSKLNYTFFLPQ